MTPLPPLLVLTDRRGCERRGRTLLATVAAAVGAGARAVVLREKDLSRPQRRELGTALLALLRPVGGVLVVASDLGLAIELGNGWAHLAEADAWPPVTAGVGLGRSCHGATSLVRAGERGAAYATLSPVFPTASKPGYGPPLGLSRLSALARGASALPIYALGGVDAATAGACRGAGARGVAVMRAVMAAEDPAPAPRRGSCSPPWRRSRPARESASQAVRIKEASSGGKERTDVRNRTEGDGARCDDRRSIAPSGGPLGTVVPRRGADAEAGRR